MGEGTGDNVIITACLKEHECCRELHMSSLLVLNPIRSNEFISETAYVNDK